MVLCVVCIKMRGTLFWLIPIYTERRLASIAGLLDITASSCVDLFSSVSIAGLPYLLVSAAEPVLLNFLTSFARCHALSAFCWLHWIYALYEGWYHSQTTKNVNPFFLGLVHLFSIGSPSRKIKLSHRFNDLYGDL